MIAQNLKKSILQEAISGRLVPQIESEGTAEDILREIAKQQKKKITFSEITEDEQPFSIPSSWRWVRLGEIMKSITDGVHQRPHYTQKGIPFLSVKDISSGCLNFSDTKYVSEDEYNAMSAGCKPNRGDIVVSKVGSNTGIPAFVDTDIKFCLFVSVALLRMYKEVDPFYIIYAIKSPLVQVQVQHNTKGVGNLNWVLKDIAATILPLPPLSEQRRIVTKLETLLPKIDSLEKTETRLSLLESTLGERLWKSVLQEAISGRLTTQQPSDGSADDLLEQIKAAHREAFANTQKKYKPLTFSPIPDSEIPFEIPENWRWVRLGEIASFNGGFAFKSEQYVSKEKGIRILRISDFDVNGIKDKNPVYYPHNSELNNYKLSVNDIIMCMTGGTVGKSFLVKSLNEEMYVNQRVADIKCFSSVNVDYIYAVILSHHIQQSIQYNKNSTNDNISADFIKNLFIPLPPLSEQLRIVSKLEKLRSALDKRG